MTLPPPKRQLDAANNELALLLYRTRTHVSQLKRMALGRVCRPHYPLPVGITGGAPGAAVENQ
jgi:hypothetical protein